MKIVLMIKYKNKYIAMKARKDMHTEYEKALMYQQEKNILDKIQNNVLNFYSLNKNIFEQSYFYYKEYENKKENYVLEPQEIPLKQFGVLVGEESILIITANSVEEAVLLHSLSDYYQKPIPSYMVGGCVYQVVAIDGVVLVHNHALYTGDEYTRRAINTAKKYFCPAYVYLLGVCYGIDYERYNIGTVFIADFIQSYRINFRDDEDSEETLYEADVEFEQYPNKNVINGMKSFFAYCQPVNSIGGEETQEMYVQIAFGKLLSSNNLVSSKRVKEAIMYSLGGARPKPLGGEMEASGIFKSAYFENGDFNNWFVIKSVCDWGENVI